MPNRRTRRISHQGQRTVNETDSEFDESPSSSGPFRLIDRLLEFWDATERVLAVIAGLLLAGLFCIMPLTSFGADEPRTNSC